MHTEEFFILSLMEIGVHGFLNKSAEPGEVERAIYSVVDKDFYQNEIVNKALLNGVKQSKCGPFQTKPKRKLKSCFLFAKSLVHQK